MNERVLLQQGWGPCTPLLRLALAHHREYCSARGIRHVPVWSRPWHIRGEELGRDKLILLDWFLHHFVSTDGMIVVLDADALIVGGENLMDALPADSEMAMVRSWNGYFNTGAWWLRNTERVRAFIARLARSPEPPRGATYGDQQRLVNELPGVQLRVAELNARWNCYGAPANTVREPVQILAWHSPDMAPALKLAAMRGALWGANHAA